MSYFTSMIFSEAELEQLKVSLRYRIGYLTDLEDKYFKDSPSTQAQDIRQELYRMQSLLRRLNTTR